MEPVIQEVMKKIINSFDEELKRLLRERKDISHFILATKKMFDGEPFSVFRTPLRVCSLGFLSFAS